MKRLLLAATLTALALAAHAQPVPSPVQPAPVKRTVLGKVEVPGANYDVITAMVEIAPGFKAGRHTHPGTVQAQILEGEFWYAIDGQPEKVAKAGEVARDPRRRDSQRRCRSARGPMKLIAIYTVERGKPLVSPVK